MIDIVKNHYLKIYLYNLVEKPIYKDPKYPCAPSPCGPYSKCIDLDERAACSCLPYHIGLPPNCRPECKSNHECLSNFACINERCKDPCPGSCASNAICRVINHEANCMCIDGYTGDPYSVCFVDKSKKFL